MIVGKYMMGNVSRKMREIVGDDGCGDEKSFVCYSVLGDLRMREKSKWEDSSSFFFFFPFLCCR